MLANALMKKGLKLKVRIAVPPVSARECPDEEGIETDNGHWGVGRTRARECPDEEGIETDPFAAELPHVVCSRMP